MVRTDLLLIKRGRNVAFLTFLAVLCCVNLTFAENTNSLLQNAMGCNDLVQVSLDVDCEAVITPEMILEGEESIPGFNPDDYLVTVEGVGTGQTVTVTSVGNYVVMITENFGNNPNSCWGNISVEDKLPPELECNCPVGGTTVTEFTGTILSDGSAPSVTTCGDIAAEITSATANYELHQFVVSGSAATFQLGFNSHTIGCDVIAGIYTDFDEDNPCDNVVDFLTNAGMDFTDLTAGLYQLVIFTDGASIVPCDYVIGSTETLQEYDEECLFLCTDLDAILNESLGYFEPSVYENCSGYELEYSDTVEPSDCAASRVIRTWVVTDAQGESATCSMEYYLANISLDDVEVPETNIEINCKKSYEPEDIYDIFRAQGSSVDDANHYAWPTINGTPIKEAICGLGVTKEDQIVPICEGEFKILRRWTVVDWCTGGIEEFMQIIKLVAPELSVSCPPDGAIGNANTYDCTGDIVLDPPFTNANDMCSDLTYTVGYISATDDGQPPLNGIYQPVDVTVSIDDQILVSNLPVGKNWIRYRVFDECERQEDCFTEVVIHDVIAPNPVCDEFTVVSLTSLGWAKVFAETFDDGSFDFCSDIGIYVRRMDNNGCANITDYPDVAYTFNGNNYYAWVPFCCKDLGENVMVELLVHDYASETNVIFAPNPDFPATSDDPVICIPDPNGEDNVNFCMVEVNVQDKTVPEITCPDDAIIYCWDDYTDTDLTNGEATVAALCSNHQVDYDDRLFLDECGIGHIIRTWFVVGYEGQVECEQRIDVERQGQIQITFPPNRDVTCTSLPGPEKPTWTGDHCSMLGWSVQSDTFNVEDGACAKVINFYTVMDWCIYDTSDPIDASSDGVWTETQVIKIFDNNPPEITCEDVMFEADDFWDADNDGVTCENKNIVLTATGNDVGNCPSNWLKWTIKVDLNSNGEYDYEWSSYDQYAPNYVAPTTSGAEVRVTIPADIAGSMNNHTVHWIVSDGCGNNGSCTSSFMVVDKKPPTPYCINLSTALMENGEVNLWACDFDLGSFDNCTETEDLRFTFRGDVSSPEADPNYISSLNCSSRAFTCDDLPEVYGDPVPVEVWVWDEKNNKDFCVVYLTLVDNQNACGDFTGGGDDLARISGQIYTEEGIMVSDVEVENTAMAVGTTLLDMTDQDGLYAFEDNLMNLEYAVDATKEGHYLNGVSTLDLVLIQKHILGIQNLSSGFKVVAADINNDEKVTAIDLIELRKLILGVYVELPTNASWRFISTDQTPDQMNPWPLIETNSISALQDDQNSEDFVAVKIGDVNGNATANANQNLVDTRSGSKLDLEVVQTADGISVVAGSNFQNVAGFQFTMQVNGTLASIYSENLNLSADNFGVLENGIITTSFAEPGMVSLEAGQTLFTLVGIQDIALVNGLVQAEAYVGDDLTEINISLRGNAESLVYELAQNKPNPFSDETSISFTIAKAGTVDLTIYDLTGKIIKQFSSQYEAGSHSITVTNDELPASGVLYYSIQSGAFSDTKKMILVK